MTAPVDRPVIHMRDIVKTYYIGQPNELEILHGISLTVHTGEFVAIVGESGSGKSTLMNVIGALDRPTSGGGTGCGCGPGHRAGAVRGRACSAVSAACRRRTRTPGGARC